MGIFIAPFLFLITDAIEEVYGKNVVFNLITAAIISLIFIFGFLSLAIWMEPAARFTHNTEYTTHYVYLVYMAKLD